jgi:hypothetical protein
VAEAVYILCALTSLACAFLLLRGYRSSRTRLLFWSSLCFIGLAANNLLLFLDLVIVPEIDLRVIRGSVALASLLLLVYGSIAESK